MSKKLEGKVALITGGSRGIGAAIAMRLAADGANVAITYAKGAEAAASVVKEIEHGGQKAIAIQADATDAAAVEAAVAKTVETFGRLDILVNNAGTAIPKRFEETTLEELDRVIDLNVRGPFIATHAALKHVKNGGRIIMIGSCVGERMMTPGLVVLLGHKRGRQDVRAGVVQRGGEPRHHGEQYSARPNRHGFESRRRRLGGTSKGKHGAKPLRIRGRCRRAGSVRGWTRGVLHHRCEFDCGWRHERVARSRPDHGALRPQNQMNSDCDGVAAAKAWYSSPLYRKARERRFKGATYRVTLVDGF